ncbi:PAC2 family protein [Candidatus Woesearchaeota archaeon]|nr:PAC2 family protein [Candidatus Woesearchaeota archaeon]
MSTWKIEEMGKKPKLKNPILVEGLPGIGNVGKVAIDFLIDELKAKKLYEITSYTFPHSVFVNEDNLVELPIIEVYYKKFGDKRADLILLGGDVQPVDEVSSYEFSEKVLDMVEQFKGKEVITLGGIGLAEVPKKPQVYCTGNTKKIIQKYKSRMVNDKLYGVVGPIIGVSGLLVGLAKRRNINAISFLAETYGHPMYLGMKGAVEILKVLKSKLNLEINMARLNEEMKEVEADMLQRTEQIGEIARQTALNKLKSRLGKEAEYIG